MATPREKAQQLINESRGSAAVQQANTRANSPYTSEGKKHDKVDPNISGQPEMATIEDMRAARAQAYPGPGAGNLDPAGNIPQDIRIDVTPDGSSGRIGGSILFDQLRSAGVPTKTFIDNSRDPLA